MRNYLLLSFLVVSFCASSLSNASTTQIEALKKENAGYDWSIRQNDKTIASNQGKIEKAIKAVEEAKYSLIKYEEAYAVAQEKYNQNASPANLKLLEMNNDRKALVVKKLTTRETRLEELKAETNQLAERNDNLSARIKANKSEIAKLENEVEKQKELQASIKAEQERQAKIAAPKLVPVIETPAPVVAKAPVKPEPIAQTPKEKKAPKPAASTNPVVIAAVEIEKYLSSKENGSPKTVLKTATTQRGKKIKIARVGKDIYRGEAELNQGDHTILFSGSRFRVNVLSENHRKPHVIYIDDRTEKRKMIFVEKSLIDTI